MILFLKTDTPYCELFLRKDDSTMIDASWQADRQLAKELLERIEAVLQAAAASWDDLKGLVVFRGPGSFTGLRIGIAVMNTIAYAKGIPVVGVSSGEHWQKEGLNRLQANEDDRIVVPEYGRDARITKPRK